ncbi:MAG: RNA-guided endonuclease TnpB family protein [Thermodesulfobacteriota bacterium]
MKVNKAYKFRFYPTTEQERAIARTFGCCRFVYNHILAYRTEAWEQRKERIGYLKASKLLTVLKKDPQHVWLSEVSSVPLQQAVRHQQAAFSNFFAGRARYPVFKSRKGLQSASFMKTSFSWDREKRELVLAKMEQPLDIRWSRTIQRKAEITSVNISRDPAGRYFISFRCQEEVNPFPVAAGEVGIDLGLNNLVVLSNGEKVPALKVYRREEARLAKLQRKLAGKKKGSRNRNKAKVKVARVYAKIADRRRDELHKLSTRLIRENQTVAVESLRVGNMLKNRRLAKAIADAGWGELVRMLEYKALWYGRNLVKADPFLPSSKTCSACGYVEEGMTLVVRGWRCPVCDSLHDRDVNAARNVLAAGLAVSACGGSVRPGVPV